MSKDLYMLAELEDGEILEIYKCKKDGEEKFLLESDRLRKEEYSSLTAIFINYLVYIPPHPTDTLVKYFVSDNKNQKRIKMSQKRALYNFHVCCTTKDFDYTRFMNWAKECEQKEETNYEF